MLSLPLILPVPSKLPLLVKLPMGSTTMEPMMQELPVAVTEVLGEMVRVEPTGILISPL